jgi:hypothetical protein
MRLRGIEPDSRFRLRWLIAIWAPYEICGEGKMGPESSHYAFEDVAEDLSGPLRR